MRKCNVKKISLNANVSISFNVILKKPTISEIVLNDNIGDGIEYKAHIVCVRCTCEMRINFFLVFSFVETFEFYTYIIGSVLISVGT